MSADASGLVRSTYLDIHISTATTPQPVTLWFTGPNIPGTLVSPPTFGVSAGGAEVDVLTLGRGLQTNLITAGAINGGGNTPAVATCGTIGTGSKNAAGFITSATTGSCVSVITFTVPATTGWSCAISNATTANIIRQTGSSTTTATFTGTTVSGDVLRYNCIGY